jgi:hypothetical protein
MRPAQPSLFTPSTIGCELLPFWQGSPRWILRKECHKISLFGHPLDHCWRGSRCWIMAPSRQNRSRGRRRPPLLDSSLHAQKCPRDAHQQEQNTHQNAQHSHEEYSVQTSICNHAATMPMERVLKSAKPSMCRKDPLYGSNSILTPGLIFPTHPIHQPAQVVELLTSCQMQPLS